MSDIVEWALNNGTATSSSELQQWALQEEGGAPETSTIDSIIDSTVGSTTEPTDLQKWALSGSPRMEAPEEKETSLLDNPILNVAASAVEIPLSMGSMIPLGALGSLQAAGNWMLTGDVDKAEAGMVDWMEEAYMPRAPLANAAIEKIGEGYQWVANSIDDTLGKPTRMAAEIGLGLLPLKPIMSPKGLLAMREASVRPNKGNYNMNVTRNAQGRFQGPPQTQPITKPKFTKDWFDFLLSGDTELRLAGLDDWSFRFQKMDAKEKSIVGGWDRKFLNDFRKDIEKLPETVQQKLTDLSLSENADAKILAELKRHLPTKADQYMQSYKEMRDWYAKELSKSMGKSKSGKPLFKKLPQYWSRMVDDWEGLISAMKQDPNVRGIEKVQKLADDLQAGVITQADAVAGVIQVLTGGGTPGTSPAKATSTYSRAKGWEKRVPDMYRPYFAPFHKAMEHYVVDTTKALVERDFLGKTGRGKKAYEEMLIDMIDKAQDSGLYTKEQLHVLQKVLQSRFGANARKHPRKSIQALKEASYMSTIVGVYPALTQLADIAGNIGDYGLLNTIRGMKKKALKAKESGVKDIQHEIAETSGPLSKALDKGLELVGFKAMDFFGKDSRLNAAYQWGTRLAQKNPNALFTRYKRWGADNAQARKYVEAWKKGDVDNPVLLEALMLELMRRQPLSLGSQALTSLKHPNARLFYVLKSWSIRQLNGLIMDITTGRKGNAAKYMAALALGTASINLMKEFMTALASGTKMDENVVTDEMVQALFQTAMPVVSRYDVETLFRVGPGEAVGKAVAPPIVSALFDAVRGGIQGDIAPTVKMIPGLNTGNILNEALKD